MNTVIFPKVDVDDIKIFYREAGPKDAPLPRYRPFRTGNPCEGDRALIHGFLSPGV